MKFSKFKILSLSILLSSFLLLSFSEKASAFGIDMREHCWQGVNSGVLIKHQVTKFGSFFNLNGYVTGTLGVSNPAYGTAFRNVSGTNIKMAYTVVRTNVDDYITVHITLDPTTLNGRKVVIFNTGPGTPEDVIHIPCP